MGASLAAVLVVLAMVPWRFAFFAAGHFLGSSVPLLQWFGCFRAPSLAVLAVVSFVLASVLLYPLEGNRLLILTNKCLCFSFGNDFPPQKTNAGTKFRA